LGYWNKEEFPHVTVKNEWLLEGKQPTEVYYWRLYDILTIFPLVPWLDITSIMNKEYKAWTEKYGCLNSEKKKKVEERKGRR
jgi:hypothetical protein